MQNQLKIAILAFNILLFSSVNGSDKVAVTTKIKGLVEVSAEEPGKYKTLKLGTVLETGNWIKTGKTGYAVLVFIDDRSVLKIKENSEMEITGNVTSTGISKKIDIESGTIRAIVNKQRKGEFLVKTPTSVASVKGTDFWLMSNPLDGDQLITLEGLVNFLNSVSGININVSAGMTGISTPDGSINQTPTNPDDIPVEAEDENSELKIQFEGPGGEEKSIRIEYR